MIKLIAAEPERGYPWWKAVRRAFAPDRRLYATLALGLIASLVIHRYVLCSVVINGQSMKPTFSEGQVCLVKNTPGQITRGDIVIIHDGQGQSIKRVVGLPNECLLFRNGRVDVNGHELVEPYLSSHRGTWAVYQTRFTLDQEHYFVMGDNRSFSEDSRVYGPLLAKNIVGRVAL